MSTIEGIKERFQSILEGIKSRSEKIILPFFAGLSLYDVSSFFFRGLFHGVITTRAGSISWSFFTALFPAVIFIFTLIPFVPIDGFQKELFVILEEVLPPTSYDLVKSTIDDILNNKHGGLLSFTFVTTIFFATNGTMSLISNVSITFHKLESRAFWQQYLVALSLTVVLGLLLLIGVAAILFGSNFTEWLVEHNYLSEVIASSLQVARYLILFVVMLVSISLIFYYGPTKKKEWGFFSPGSVLSTFLIILFSIAFSFYVDNFANYNQLYGSIGALLVIMLWIYLSSIGLVVGFELNASMVGAKLRRLELKEEEEE